MTDNNNDGLWLSVGIGSSNMAGADFGFCVFNFTTASANDNFNCTQRHTSGFSLPTVNTNNNINNVATNRNYD